MRLPNWNDVDVYFNGVKYVWEAAFINGSNWYTSTIDDWLLCAIVNNSCWETPDWNSENIKANALTDQSWNEIRDPNCRWLKIFIN